MTVENEELSDDQLFNSAVGDEPEITPEAPVVEEQPEKPEVVAGSETPAEKPVVDDNAPLVPSWRLREIGEEKRALADRLAAAEAKLALQPVPKAEAPKVETRPDPLLDPEGYAKAIREEVRQEAVAERREESMARALETNPEDFKAAYKAATENGVIPELKLRMHSARDPGKELLAWHKEQKVKAEVGTDPNAWLEKKLEERLKDPAFLAKAVELARGSAQSQPSNGRPRVELPPSLSGSSRANAALKSSNDDVDDHQLFAEITG